jgi:hypothetical protein
MAGKATLDHSRRRTLNHDGVRLGARFRLPCVGLSTPNARGRGQTCLWRTVASYRESAAARIAPGNGAYLFEAGMMPLISTIARPCPAVFYKAHFLDASSKW